MVVTWHSQGFPKAKNFSVGKYTGYTRQYIFRKDELPLYQ